MMNLFENLQLMKENNDEKLMKKQHTLIDKGKILDSLWNKCKIKLNNIKDQNYILNVLFASNPMYDCDDPMNAYFDLDDMFISSDFFEEWAKSIDCYSDTLEGNDKEELNYQLDYTSKCFDDFIKNIQNELNKLSETVYSINEQSNYTLQNKYANNIEQPLSNNNINKIISIINKYRFYVKQCTSLFNILGLDKLIQIFNNYHGDNKFIIDYNNENIEWLVQTALSDDLTGNAIAEDFRQIGDNYGPIANQLIGLLLSGTFDGYDDDYSTFGENKAVELELQPYINFINNAKNFIKKYKKEND